MPEELSIYPKVFRNYIGQCGTLVGALSQAPEGCGRFNFRSGHVPGFGFNPRSGPVWEATVHCVSFASILFSLSPSLPL